MNIEMSIWIWCFGIIVSTYMETMDRKNLIRIAPSVVTCKNKDTVVKWSNLQRVHMCSSNKHKQDFLQS